MQIIRHKKFDKEFNKLSQKIKKQFKDKILIFIENPYDIRLNNHRLHGSMYNYRSINITGDYRLIYEEIDEKTFMFISIDTHSNLYN